MPSVADTYSTERRRTAAADSALCNGISPQFYGTTFEIVPYDTNIHLGPIVFGHIVGPEFHETWCTIFEEIQEGFWVRYTRLGTAKAFGLCIYDRAVRAPTKAAVEGILKGYTIVQK